MSNKHEDYLGVKDFGTPAIGTIKTMWGPLDNGSGNRPKEKPSDKGLGNRPKENPTDENRKPFPVSTGNGNTRTACPAREFLRRVGLRQKEFGASTLSGGVIDPEELGGPY